MASFGTPYEFTHTMIEVYSHGLFIERWINLPLTAKLITALKDKDRKEDAFRAASDVKFRNSLYKEFGIA